MRVLFVFLDGVGLGANDPQNNPFATIGMPAVERLLGDRRLLAEHAPLENGRATLLPLDAGLGIHGLPQSATGQAALLTGRNIPAELGYHYGPKPNPEIAAFIKNGNLFKHLQKKGKRCAFLNAYPPGYFQAIQSGRRLYAAIPLAVTSAGIALRTDQELRAGQAISADFTGEGWRTYLGLADTPVISPYQAGERLAHLARDYDFALFEYWLTDYAGHGQDMHRACELIGNLDQVLDGLLRAWDDETGLILITSDHGNMEDLSTRRHTANPVPALLIGAPAARQAFSAGLKDLSGITPAILRMLADDSAGI
jgi:hypothetical protein